jgi:hypothetical protein
MIMTTRSCQTLSLYPIVALTGNLFPLPDRIRECPKESFDGI